MQNQCEFYGSTTRACKRRSDWAQAWDGVAGV